MNALRDVLDEMIVNDNVDAARLDDEGGYEEAAKYLRDRVTRILAVKTELTAARAQVEEMKERAEAAELASEGIDRFRAHETNDADRLAAKCDELTAEVERLTLDKHTLIHDCGDLSAQLTAERTRSAKLVEALEKLINDLQGLAMAEHGSIGMAVDYAPSIPDAIAALTDSRSSAVEPSATEKPTPRDHFASLREYVTDEGISKSKEVFDGCASFEVLVIATALRELADSCSDAAQFANDDDRPLKAEEFESRAGRYIACYNKIVEEWDGDPSAGEVKS